MCCVLQIFAVELVSHLSIQYALPKSLGAAKLVVSVVTTLLTGNHCHRYNYCHYR